MTIFRRAISTSKPYAVSAVTRIGTRQTAAVFGSQSRYFSNFLRRFERPPQLTTARLPHNFVAPTSWIELVQAWCKPPAGFENFFPGAKKDKDGEEKKEEDGGDGDKKSTGSEEGGDKKGDGKDGKDGNNNPFGQFEPPQLGLIVATSLLVMFYTLSLAGEKRPELSFQELNREFLSRGWIEKIVIVNKQDARVYVRPDASPEHSGKVYSVQIGSPEHFETRLEQAQASLGIRPHDFIRVAYSNEVSFGDEMFRWLPTLLFMLPLLFLLRGGMGAAGGMGGGGGGGGGLGGSGRNMFNIGKAMPKGTKDQKSKVRFKDVAGMTGAKAEVMEFVDFLKNPKFYERIGAKIPKGGLLVGPPGTGKTLLAKAVAGEADRPFFSMSGSDFIEMFVGVGPSRVRDLFTQARNASPSIIFIDEIDAVGRKRGKGGFAGGNDERESTLNQLLVEMDGFASSTGIVVLASTNRADILDAALMRPGRFDRQIAIDKPDLSEREEIFHVHMKPLKLTAGVSATEIARRMAALTPGFVGADIANLCNEAAIHTARRKGDTVDIKDFELASERIIGGLAKNNNLMSPEEKRTTALHESGHAVAGWFTKGADPLLKVSIVPRAGGALGYAQYLPDEMMMMKHQDLLDKLVVLLAGRAAEELFVGEISTGASDDLRKVTKIAYSIVSIFGMNKDVGLLSYPKEEEMEMTKPYSDETARLIDKEARDIVEQQYAACKALLLEKEDLLKKFADLLFEKETVVFQDIVQILGPRPFPVKEQMRKFVEANTQMQEDAEVQKERREKEEAEKAAEDAKKDEELKEDKKDAKKDDESNESDAGDESGAGAGTKQAA